MSKVIIFIFAALVLSGCITRNTDPGLAGRDLSRVTCPLSDSDETCGRRALNYCKAKGFDTVAGLSIGRESRVIQNNCSVIGGIRACTPGSTTVKTATFICTHSPA